MGLPPKNMAKSPIPKCAGCIFDVMTKKIWRTKGKITVGQVGQMTKIKRPGKCVSVDML